MGWLRGFRLGSRRRRRWRRHQIDFAACASGVSEDDPLALGVQAERLAAHLAGQVERLLGNAVAGQLQGVGGHPGFQRVEYLRAAPKKRSAGTRPSMPL